MVHDPDPIDLRLLLTFEAVVRTGSVTAAAKEFGRTQSAISHRIRSLEDDLGVAVFERRGPRLQLTDYGERLRALCADLVGRSKHIRAQLLEELQPEGTITIGTFTGVASRLLPRPMQSLLAAHDRLSLELTFGFVDGLFDGLRSGRIDFVVAATPRAPSEFSSFHLGDTPLVAVLPPDADPELTGTVTASDLRERAGRYLSYGGMGDPIFEAIERFAVKERLASEWSSAIPSIETLRAFVAAGAGYSLLPEYVVREEAEDGRLRAVDVEGLEPGAPFQLVKRVTAVRTPALEVVETAIRSAVSGGLQRAVD